MAEPIKSLIKHEAQCIIEDAQDILKFLSEDLTNSKREIIYHDCEEILLKIATIQRLMRQI